MSRAFVCNLLKQRRETGSIEPKQYRPGPKRKHSQKQRDQLILAAGERHDLTLDQLHRRLRLPVCLSEVIVTSKQLTITSYNQTIGNLKTFFGADRNLADIKPSDADEFRLFLLTGANKHSKEGLKTATAKRRLQRASTVFRSAMRKGIIDTNPFDGV